MRRGHCTISGMDDPRRRVEKSANRAEQQQTRQVEMQKNPNKAIKFPGSKQRIYAKHINKITS